MTDYQLIRADAVKWAADYQGSLFHALLCDPPYNLAAITKRFGKPGAAEAQPGKDGYFKRRTAGFMGQKWDTDVGFRPETWAAFANVLLPGGYGMAFGGSRTYHRLAVAIEDAGLLIHPSIFGWAYGSGMNTPSRADTPLDDPDWSEHRYGADTLKPALEPIIVFQKPFEGRRLDVINEHGSGTMWTEGALIPVNNGTGISGGRKPANFYLQHLPGCATACVPGCPVKRLGRQSGERAASAVTNSKPRRQTGHRYDSFPEDRTFDAHDDTGTAARFYFNADWSHDIAERLAAAETVHYQAKPGRAEKEAGLDHLSLKLKHRVNSGGLENEERFAPVEARNIHPTNKPISLAQWLATLLLPPAKYAPRRLFVPFAGVGSEICGAILAGFDEIIGVELDLGGDYIPVGRARLAYWDRAKQFGSTNVKQALSGHKPTEGQMSLF